MILPNDFQTGASIATVGSIAILVAGFIHSLGLSNAYYNSSFIFYVFAGILILFSAGMFLLLRIGNNLSIDGFNRYVEFPFFLGVFFMIIATVSMLIAFFI